MPNATEMRLSAVARRRRTGRTRLSASWRAYGCALKVRNLEFAAPKGNPPTPAGKWATNERCEARQPRYGSSMGAQPHPEDFDAEPVHGRATPASQREDGLYRYVPVPPAGYDDDGYLIEDEKPQPSVDHHRQTTHWREALALHLPAATVCSNLTVHYREGDRGAAIVPDLFVALRAPPLEERWSYKLWQYPVPELVAEMLSEDTAKDDVGSKQYTYAYLGVTEYWLFDPLGLQLSTPLVGYRLDAGRRYRQTAADAFGRLYSRALGLDLHVRAGKLRFRDPAQGEDLRTFDESERRLAAAERGWAAEKSRADAAERELAHLRSRLEGS